MKLSIEATDKLENKDFHYELTVSKNTYRHGLWHRAISLALVAWLKKNKKLEA